MACERCREESGGDCRLPEVQMWQVCQPRVRCRDQSLRPCHMLSVYPLTNDPTVILNEAERCSRHMPMRQTSVLPSDHPTIYSYSSYPSLCESDVERRFCAARNLFHDDTAIRCIQISATLVAPRGRTVELLRTACPCVCLPHRSISARILYTYAAIKDH